MTEEKPQGAFTDAVGNILKEIKPGYLTTEFWQSSGVVGGLIVIAQTTEDETVKLIALVGAAVVTVGYMIARAYTKKA